MARREVAVGDFRQRATELVRHVEETKEAITITRRGVPVAELRAVTVDPEALLGSVTYLDPDLTGPSLVPTIGRRVRDRARHRHVDLARERSGAAHDERSTSDRRGRARSGLLDQRLGGRHARREAAHPARPPCRAVGRRSARASEDPARSARAGNRSAQHEAPRRLPPSSRRQDHRGHRSRERGPCNHTGRENPLVSSRSVGLMSPVGPGIASLALCVRRPRLGRRKEAPGRATRAAASRVLAGARHPSILGVPDRVSGDPWALRPRASLGSIFRSGARHEAPLRATSLSRERRGLERLGGGARGSHRITIASPGPSAIGTTVTVNAS